MTRRQNERDYDDESEDGIMNDDIDFIEEESDDDAAEVSPRARAFNLDMRHRIEDRLEQRRLAKELGDYEFFDLEDDDTVH
ncbi:PA3496 family putative envelope integrity protein [Isoalcanivorax beigongshangi]|uniref:PA3496 family putative envelope integrity protein n=1 Tax=Isoalcanivorax beigongshangi TaxID=3238810 RepID=A0ABV4AI19_9GAMM